MESSRDRGHAAGIAMTREMQRLSEELGIAPEPGAVLAALANIRAGRDAESASKGLTWFEFEPALAASKPRVASLLV